VQLLFEANALDIDRRELRRDSELIAVGPQVFDLLVYLVRNRARVVSKDDLLQAVWQGRIVSESTLTSHINAARKAIGDSGDSQRLIRTVARKGFRFVGEISEQPRAGIDEKTRPVPVQNITSSPVPVLPPTDKPSIAVMPFQNMSGDAEQDYFADGMVEEIITALSRISSLLVIARNSSFTYRGRMVDVKQVGRELGVRYVLEGGVRKVANRVRISGQLIDADTGMHLWADRFDGLLEDIFDLQDQVTARVVGAIAPKLEQAEIERARRKPIANLDAYDYYLRAMASLYRWTRESNDEALRLLYKAVELDPNLAFAYGVAAWCYVWRKTQSWVGDSAQESAEGTRLARLAVELGKDDAIALSAGGYALAHIAGDLEGGAGFIERALVLNPNLSGTWLNSGWVNVWLGQPELAIEHLARAMRLSPRDPILFRMQGATASAHFFAGRYDDASSWAEKALRENPNSRQALRVAAASHALGGRMDAARRAIGRMRELDPELSIANLRDRLPALRPEDLARYAEGLRKAGVPEDGTAHPQP
jgi:TolB-like protein/tetratricopeptide (TPR) repeat protein